MLVGIIYFTTFLTCSHQKCPMNTAIMNDEKQQVLHVEECLPIVVDLKLVMLTSLYHLAMLE